MKKSILNIVLFFAIVAIVDICFGKGMDYIHARAKGGTTREMNNICLHKQYDVIVMGSSRAHHHYVPEIISDSLGMSCYNTGIDGNGIILMYGIYQMILDRYKPSLIIYDLSKGFDLYENPIDQNNTRYVSMLKPYARRPKMDEIFKSLSWQEWVKTYFSLYCFNSITVTTIRDYLFERPFNVDGYEKETGVMNYEPTTSESEDSGILDSLKLFYFEKYLRSLRENHIPVVCVLSPRYRSESSWRFQPLFDLCTQYDVPVLDYYTDTTFSTHRELFKDATHMNDRGARLFTSQLVNDLKTTKRICFY